MRIYELPSVSWAVAIVEKVQFRNNEIEIFFYGAVNDYQQSA